VFVHISAVKRAGLSTLAEGAKVTFDIVDNRGKEAADNLRLVIGGSLAGICAARVWSDVFDKVTIIERDAGRSASSPRSQFARSRTA
jgi:heterodisulfide reductase subunit A-like polyferredoxin